MNPSGQGIVRFVRPECKKFKNEVLTILSSQLVLIAVVNIILASSDQQRGDNTVCNNHRLVIIFNYERGLEDRVFIISADSKDFCFSQESHRALRGNQASYSPVHGSFLSEQNHRGINLITNTIMLHVSRITIQGIITPPPQYIFVPAT